LFVSFTEGHLGPNKNWNAIGKAAFSIGVPKLIVPYFEHVGKTKFKTWKQQYIGGFFFLFDQDLIFFGSNKK